ncbi:hypothetical protein SAMN05421505_11188 [Sinosporangium album]|uniref:DUF6879 domain-containing protein n=1 Tax=Sinosporangium album TaxID=504805 RepID=A0A1G7ZKJ5_9ACTN|nr:DUF6879 family protein [Sinosporangium album]SDH09076.1 hypothetical protein SAMN05421505_11188 [Sinosporangium album]
MADFSELLASCERTAFKLEMRDQYMTADPGYLAWEAGDLAEAARLYADWTNIAKTAVERGVLMRRVRIISEPVSTYISFEHAVTPTVNLAAGEAIKWLPRRAVSDLALPGNDVWIFDDRMVQFCHFAGDGTWVSNDESEDPATVKLCATAFASAWDRAVDHSEYRI